MFICDTDSETRNIHHGRELGRLIKKLISILRVSIIIQIHIITYPPSIYEIYAYDVVFEDETSYNGSNMSDKYCRRRYILKRQH